MKSVSVIYLIGKPFSIEYFGKFMSSYLKYSAGYEHKLVLLFNGDIDQDLIYKILRYANLANVDFKFLKTEQVGGDLDSYYWVSGVLKTDYILFFNSYCEILAGNWLLKYMNAITLPNVGIVGATGSFQSYYTYCKEENNFKSLKSAKMWLKNYFLYRFYFKPFPNPHIRTNAFIINRELFLSLKLPKGQKRIQRYRFESGKNGLSAQLIKKGYCLIVIDKFGGTHKKDRWKWSHTFWFSNQIGLLISDNRTRDYDNADEKLKAHFRYLAWGIK